MVASKRRISRRYLRNTCEGSGTQYLVCKQHNKGVGITFRLPSVTTFLILLSSISTIATSNERKNVLIIIGDDAGFETQVYDNMVCKTPNLNALGKRSVIFRKAFTSVSSCSPSRSTILTGVFYEKQKDVYQMMSKVFLNIRMVCMVFTRMFITLIHLMQLEVYLCCYKRQM